MDVGDGRVESGSNDGHRSFGTGVEIVDALDERANQMVAIGQVVGERSQPRQLIVVELTCQFSQREGTAAGCLDATLGDGGVGADSQQRDGIVDVEAFQVDGLEPGIIERGWQVCAFGDDRHHRLVGESPQREGQCRAGCDVDPLRIVDQQQKWCLLAGCGQGREGCPGDL